MKEVRDAAQQAADAAREAVDAAHEAAREVRDSLHGEGKRMRHRRHRMQRGTRFGGLVWGGVLLLVGSLLLLDRIGIDTPNIGDLWPIFPMMGGVAFLVSFFSSEKPDPGAVWPGIFFLLLGSFFFLFTFGVLDWDEMAIFWPAYPLMVGIAFFTTWVAGRFSDSGLVGSGTFMVLFGVVALSMTIGILEWGDARNLWPLILVAIGASMVLRSRSSS